MTQEEKGIGPGYETSDANARVVVILLAVVAALLLSTLLLTVFIQRYFKAHTSVGQPASSLTPARVTPPGPKLQVQPWLELQRLRTHEEKILNGYGRDKDGHMYIPIERAIDLIAPSLPVRPNSPSGLTTPGGQGREYSHGLGGLPSQTYTAPPQLKGEVNKHAQ